jgi:hypothetical protein
MFVCKTRQASHSAVNFYNAGVVTRDRRIGSWQNLTKLGTLFSAECKSITFSCVVVVHLTATKNLFRVEQQSVESQLEMPNEQNMWLSLRD